MSPFPVLQTARLKFRRFEQADASVVQRLAGEKEVAQGTLLLPHPYPDGVAEQWIAEQREAYEAGTLVNFAIVLAADNQLIGSIGLEVVVDHHHARMGYWLGRPYWNQGYATEAVTAVLAHGFDHLRLNRIYAPHFHTNPASGRVLRKVGMTYEGRMREHYRRFDRFVDVEIYGMLRQEFVKIRQETEKS